MKSLIIYCKNQRKLRLIKQLLSEIYPETCVSEIMTTNKEDDKTATYAKTANEPKPELISLRINNITKEIDPNDIIYIKAERNYCNIILRNKPRQFVVKTLKEILSKLGNDFLKVHKSYAININYISEIINSRKPYILMKNHENVPVARRNKQLIYGLANKIEAYKKIKQLISV